MKQVRRNKKKVWRKTYGKLFIKRKAICIAQIAVANAQAIAQINIISCCCYSGLAQKALATANAMISLSKAVADKSHEMNEGFVTK